MSIAGDPGEVLEALSNAPQTWRVVLAWAGEEDQTGQPLAGIMTNTIEVWIIKAKGLKLEPGAHLLRGPGAFLAILSQVRAFVRAHEWPDEITDTRVLYQGCRPMEPELVLALNTAGYKLTFTLTSAIPVYTP